MRLSNHKLGRFDRHGGAYLVLPWPAELPHGEAVADGEERAATQREHLAAMRIVAPVARQYGLLHIATQVAQLRAANSPGQYLLAHMVTPRWQRVTEPGAMATVCWPEMMR